MTIKIFSPQEKKEIIENLKNKFGIKEIPGILLRVGKERLFIFDGNLNEEQLKKLENEKIFIERAGVYIGKIQEEEIRLSIDGTNYFKNQITKNIFEIEDKDVESWMQGSELNISTELRGYVIIKNGNDFLGSGKASQQKISNFVPKSRRLKFRN